MSKPPNETLVELQKQYLRYVTTLQEEPPLVFDVKVYAEESQQGNNNNNKQRLFWQNYYIEMHLHSNKKINKNIIPTEFY